MRSIRARVRRDERGASLILAIVFVLVAGGIGAALTSSLVSGFDQGKVLTSIRNREYAADGAIETAIGQVRSKMTSGQALAPCAGVDGMQHTLNSVTIQVDCNFVPTPSFSGFWQRNATFVAHCPNPPQANCPFKTTIPIISAEVNFASSSRATLPSITVTATTIQSWSVDG